MAGLIAVFCVTQEMTGANYVFALKSPRGWETSEHCDPGQCHLGFAWYKELAAVRCLILQQGETHFHAPSITLQRREGAKGTSLGPGAGWTDEVTWTAVDAGRSKLALSCPARPVLKLATVSDCQQQGPRSQECKVDCEEGYGTLEPRMRCVQGAWYTPECLPLGSLVRLVPETPRRLEPYWVVLDATLYSDEDCTSPIPMDGFAISSGEYVIKYASYHPKHVWDSNPETSWASKGPCAASGPCWVGFRFRHYPGPIRCAIVEHPEGEQYQASSLTVQTLGIAGWDKVSDVTVRLMPQRKQEL